MAATPNPRKTNGAARRKVRAQVLAEETTCALCGGEVDKTLTMLWGQHGPRCRTPDCPGCVPHPMRAEVDEVVPVALGGSPFDRANCQLSHRICNQLKGDGRAATATNPDHGPTDEREPFPLSDIWAGRPWSKEHHAALGV